MNKPLVTLLKELTLTGHSSSLITWNIKAVFCKVEVRFSPCLVCATRAVSVRSSPRPGGAAEPLLPQPVQPICIWKETWTDGEGDAVNGLLLVSVCANYTLGNHPREHVNSSQTAGAIFTKPGLYLPCIRLVALEHPLSGVFIAQSSAGGAGPGQALRGKPSPARAPVPALPGQPKAGAFLSLPCSPWNSPTPHRDPTGEERARPGTARETKPLQWHQDHRDETRTARPDFAHRDFPRYCSMGRDLPNLDFAGISHLFQKQFNHILPMTISFNECLWWTPLNNYFWKNHSKESCDCLIETIHLQIGKEEDCAGWYSASTADHFLHRWRFTAAASNLSPKLDQIVQKSPLLQGEYPMSQPGTAGNHCITKGVSSHCVWFCILNKWQCICIIFIYLNTMI